MRSEDRRSLVLAVFAAAAFASASASGCTSAPPAPVAVDVTADTRCSKRASFTQERVFGSSLPPHTLALTFDDGPSERTLELGAYLAAEGIEAGFFVNGMPGAPDRQSHAGAPRPHRSRRVPADAAG
jgi:hypothetical protein